MHVSVRDLLNASTEGFLFPFLGQRQLRLYILSASALYQNPRGENLTGLSHMIELAMPLVFLLLCIFLMVLLQVPVTCAKIVETIRHSLFIFVTCSK